MYSIYYILYILYFLYYIILYYIILYYIILYYIILYYIICIQLNRFNTFVRIVCFDEASQHMREQPFEARYWLILSHYPPDHSVVVSLQNERQRR